MNKGYQLVCKRTSRCHWAKCDECGCTFGEDAESDSHYDSDSDLIEKLKENGWDVQDDKVLCPACKAKATTD